jgi:hypothetical protein
MDNLHLDKEYWNSRYHNQQTGWDIGAVSYPLKAYIDQLDDKDIAIIIPGCGNAYEAEYLLQQGFTNIRLIDIAPAAVEAVAQKLQPYGHTHVHIICADFFDLHATFDLVIEQTFFCALQPGLRNAYVEKMYQLLNKNGKLAGLLFNCTFDEGPPFGGSKAEYENLFASKFTIKIMEACTNSVHPRLGKELFVVLNKKDLE